MKKLTSTLKFVGMLLVLVIMFYVINAFTTSTTSANSDLSKSGRLMMENMELKTKYNRLHAELNEIKSDLNKINYYDKYIYATLNGATPDSCLLMNCDTVSIDYTNLSNDSIFESIDYESLRISKLVASELLTLRDASTRIRDVNYYPNITPIRTQHLIRVSSEFGWRKHPIFKTTMFHDGVDISANVGTPIYATASGVIDFVMYSRYGYGNRIVILHKGGYETLYAHLGADIKVRKGQYVKKGQLIGSVGNTGRSTGAHLHYEIRYNDVLKDPLGYFYTYITGELLADNSPN